jgi:integrase
MSRPRASCTVTRFTPAGLSGISAHAMRKAFAAQQAEQESSTSEIAALGGWNNRKQVETYTKSARQKKLAGNVVSRRQKRAQEERDTPS